MKVFEAALLMSACQEHGKWHLEKRRKAERRKGVKEGWGGYVCERVVHFGVLFWDTLLGHVLGCLCGAFAWGKRFCDERKMVDVDAFYGVKSLSKCCFAALCFVLFCPMLLWF
ncbi:hypothetical protein [Bartonella sp. AC331YNZD]|uniref:hypothetical protein n=2 Tax=unclassified Bartonella TaxID=2645622 RepID=UPI0035D0ADD3